MSEAGARSRNPERNEGPQGINIFDSPTTGVIPKACVFSSRPRDLAWSALEFEVAPREIPHSAEVRRVSG